jgi:hypothetical protein
MAVVQQPIEDRRGDHLIPVSEAFSDGVHLPPLHDRPVGGDQHAAALIAAGDQLEEQVRRCRFSLLAQLGLLRLWCIDLARSRRSGPGYLGFLLPLPRCTSSGLRFHLLARLPNPGQPVLTTTQLIRQLTAAIPLAVPAILLRIEDLGLAHQGVDLLLQLLLGLEHPLVAHGLVLGGIGVNLGAIEGHMAEAHHPSLLAQPQDLNKQALEGIEIVAPELADAAVIRLLVASQHPEDQLLVAGALNLAGRDGAHAVGVEHQHRHHARI